VIVAGKSPAALALGQFLAGQGHIVLSVPESGTAVWDEAVKQAQRDQGGLVGAVAFITPPAMENSLAELSLAEFDAALVQTAGDCFTAMRAAVPAMRAGGGSMLIVWEPRDDDADLFEAVFYPAVEMVTRVIALECNAAAGVRVNLLRWHEGAAGLADLQFWTGYLLGEGSSYVTGAAVGGRARP